jgi:hypothetical protein
MTKHAPLIAIVVTAFLAGAVSCVSSKIPPLPSQDEIIDAGAALFSEGKIAEAEDAWADIPDPAERGAYLSFAKSYTGLDTAIAKAEKALSEAKPEDAIASVKDSKELPPAPDRLGSADPRGVRDRLAKIGSAAGKTLAARAAAEEKQADQRLASARSSKAKEGAAQAAVAVEGYVSAHRLFLAVSDWMPETALGAARTETKAKDAETLHKALLKDSLLLFPNRMGEVFARAPRSSDKIDDKALLAFAAETASMISGGISDFEQTIAAYPELLDKATVDRLRSSARGLAARFARIEGAIKAVKDRGKPVMPIIIGIFNPEPDDPQRSRPASFSGDSAAGPEWWWGIADIPRGVAQDLVVTMSDSRPVRIYAAGLAPDGKRPSSDLVNPLFRVGNSWPVLNAGARLNEGVFHIEVGPGRTDLYNGVAVVYKSFMMRTR